MPLRPLTFTITPHAAPARSPPSGCNAAKAVSAAARYVEYAALILLCHSAEFAQCDNDSIRVRSSRAPAGRQGDQKITREAPTGSPWGRRERGTIPVRSHAEELVGEGPGQT
jgi:hypothetical protein